MASFFDRLLGRHDDDGLTVSSSDTGYETVSQEDRQIPHNPQGREFLDSVKDSIARTVDKFSVTTNTLRVSGSPFSRGGSFGSSGVLVNNSNVDSSFSETKLGLSIPVDTNKIARIQSYDNIARYPELNWCINEISNDFLHADIDDEYIKLKIKAPDNRFNDGEDTILQEEFKHMASLYDLKTSGFNMIRKFLTEGEICFENVIDPKHPEFGIIGFKYVPTMFYDFLRNRETGQLEGIYIDPERVKTYAQFSTYAGNGYAGQSSQVYNAIRSVPAYSYTYSIDMKNKIVMPFEQVTYMNSGILSEDSSIVFPPIEQVVVPVRQLLLMHDALVIYRITRAPEKLAFNVDLGKMPAKKAREMVRRMAVEHKSRKAVQGSGAVTNVYNAETMLDAYYFWKTSEGAGTTVTSLNSTSHYNELNDVEYFLKRILKFLNIPWQRWAESAANRQDKQSIQNEEYSFAQMIVRYQTMFSAAVKKTFITHLRLKGLFEKYDLHESDFDVEMIAPAMFENYQALQRFKDKLDIVQASTGIDFLSKNFVLKKVFNFTDEEIKENELELRRETLIKAQTDYATQQISGGNPKVYLDVEKYSAPQDAGGGLQPPPGPGGMPPEGGGAPVGGTPEDQLAAELAAKNGTPQGAEGGAAPAPSPDQAAAMGGEIPPAEQAPATEQPPEGALTPEEQQKADAAFAKYQGSNGVSVSNAPSAQTIPTDDSNRTVAQASLPENPEYGDYQNAVKTTTTGNITIYPETEKGLEQVKAMKSKEEREEEKSAPAGSLEAVFDKYFNTENKSEYAANVHGPLTDIFNEYFGKDAAEEINSSNIDFSNGKSKKQSLHSVFKSAFGKKEKIDQTLGDALDGMFGNEL